MKPLHNYLKTNILCLIDKKDFNRTKKEFQA